eukprot:g5442.t1
MRKVRIERGRENLGDVLVATKSMDIGQVVLKEEPVLVASRDPTKSTLRKPKRSQISTSDDPLTAEVEMFYFMHLEAFARANRDVQRKVLDTFFCPTVEVFSKDAELKRAYSVLRSRGERVASFVKRFNAEACRGLTLKELEKVSLIYDLNAHRLGNSDVLFEYASKITHSCAPNTRYDPRTGSVVALKPIKKGDLITSNYLDTNLFPTRYRRELLCKTKLFWCKCRRCEQGVDLPRAMPCVNCVKRGEDGLFDLSVALEHVPVSYVTRRGILESNKWRCSNCRKSFDSNPLAPIDKIKDPERHLEILALDMTCNMKQHHKDAGDFFVYTLRLLGARHWIPRQVQQALLRVGMNENMDSKKREAVHDGLDQLWNWVEKHTDGDARYELRDLVILFLRRLSSKTYDRRGDELLKLWEKRVEIENSFRTETYLSRKSYVRWPLKIDLPVPKNLKLGEVFVSRPFEGLELKMRLLEPCHKDGDTFRVKIPKSAVDESKIESIENAYRDWEERGAEIVD